MAMQVVQVLDKVEHILLDGYIQARFPHIINILKIVLLEDILMLIIVQLQKIFIRNQINFITLEDVIKWELVIMENLLIII